MKIAIDKVRELFLDKTKSDQEMLYYYQRIWKDCYFIKTCCGMPGDEYNILIGNQNSKDWYDYSPTVITDMSNENMILYSLLTRKMEEGEKILFNRLLEDGRDTLEYLNRLYERHGTESMSGKVMIEVGAHQGHNTVPLSKYYDNIICVEPFTQNTDILRYNLLANDIRNVHVYENAISNNKGIVTLSQHDARITFDEKGSLKKGINDYYRGAYHVEDLHHKALMNPEISIPRWHKGRDTLTSLDIEVNSEDELEHDVYNTSEWHESDLNFSMVVTIDDFIYLQPTLLKIDVEGQEYETVLGAVQTIEMFSPNILIEVHETVSVDPKEFYRYFTFDDYDLYCLRRNSTMIERIWDSNFVLKPDSYLIGVSKNG